MVQIPKAGGGKRPIGLLPGVVRLWERARRPVVQKWRTDASRWAAKGRSPQAAAWLQAFRAEAATARGLSAAAAMLDLVKAFEMVRLEVVWARGIELGFPPVILRLVLETFSFSRRLLMDGAVSAPVDSLSAIPAGGRFATDAMLIILIRPCDTLVRSFLAADICLFVDDISVCVVGREAAVQAQLDLAVNLCMQTLEEELQLKVSRPKTIVVDRPSQEACAQDGQVWHQCQSQGEAAWR